VLKKKTLGKETIYLVSKKTLVKESIYRVSRKKTLRKETLILDNDDDRALYYRDHMYSNSTRSLLYRITIQAPQGRAAHVHVAPN
jgi:hypothetical protein